MAQKHALFEEVQQRLIRLGLADDARRAVMALVHNAAAGQELPPDAPDSRVQVLVARTFYKTALRATEALGTTSISVLIMLFDLFVAFEQDRTVSVSSLCIASGAAPTTALRQIGLLEERGFVSRRGDDRDRRRCWVLPTPLALALIRGIVEDWTAALS